MPAIDGQLTVKRLHQKNKQLFLMPENEKFNPIEVTPENQMLIFDNSSLLLRKL